MDLKKGLILGLLVSLSTFCFSQNSCLPCLKLHISGGTDSTTIDEIFWAKLDASKDRDHIKFDSIWYYRVFYTIENCGSKDFLIDTKETPNYDDADYRRVNFQFYRADTNGRFKIYPPYEGDVQELYDPEDHSKNLKPREKFTYSFSLFGYYIVREPGTYRIYASYKFPLGEGKGYYLQQSENYIELHIK